jgi:hypothetical protein
VGCCGGRRLRQQWLLHWVLPLIVGPAAAEVATVAEIVELKHPTWWGYPVVVINPVATVVGAAFGYYVSYLCALPRRNILETLWNPVMGVGGMALLLLCWNAYSNVSNRAPTADFSDQCWRMGTYFGGYFCLGLTLTGVRQMMADWLAFEKGMHGEQKG